MTATAEEDKYPSKELKKSVYIQLKNDEGTERRVMSCFVIDSGCYLSFSETYLKGEKFNSHAVIFRINEADAKRFLRFGRRKFFVTTSALCAAYRKSTRR